MKFLFLAAVVLLIIFSLDNVYADSEQDKKNIFDLLSGSPEALLSELDIPETSAGDEIEPELTTPQTTCKEGLTLVIKAADSSPKCVKPTTMFNLMERDWIIVREAFAQEDAVPLEITSSDKEQAMFYSVRASGGLLQNEIVSNFHKFTPYTSEEPHITPDNPVDKRTKMKFALESLPSKDKIEFYRFIGKIMLQEPLAREPFEVNVDVVAGDGTVLQTWAYRNCEIQNYVTYLQDTVFFFQFSGEQRSEIRDRTLVQCSALELKVPE